MKRLIRLSVVLTMTLLFGNYQTKAQTAKEYIEAFADFSFSQIKKILEDAKNAPEILSKILDNPLMMH